ncbi:MAG: hypothetical protein GY769_24880, partial [bacterium]|nr:hypothetical protein [bacterium]
MALYGRLIIILLGLGCASWATPIPYEVLVDTSSFSGATGAEMCSYRGRAVGDWFGYSVAFAGDLNRDGLGDVVVGALL